MSIPDYIPLDQFRNLDWMSSRFPRPDRQSYINGLLASISNIEALMGTPDGARNLGQFTGDVLPDNASLKVVLQAIEEELQRIFTEAPVIASEADAEAGTDNQRVMTPLRVAQATANKAQASAIGISGSAENMDDFDGETIPANQTVKQALQALETAVEGRVTTTALASTDADNGAGLVGYSGAATYAANTVGKELQLRAPLSAPDITGGVGSIATTHRFSADFFNPADDYSRAGNLDRVTDTATGDGKIRFTRLVDNIVSSARTNGPGQASVAMGLRSIKPDWTTNTGTQEVDGLFVQTKTGLAGDTSGILVDAAGRAGGTSFVNMLEGSAWIGDASGAVVAKIRYQGPQFNQVDGTSTGEHIIAEKGIHRTAYLITGNSAVDYFENFLMAYTNGALKVQMDKDGNCSFAGVMFSGEVKTDKVTTGTGVGGDPSYLGKIRLTGNKTTRNEEQGIEFKSQTVGAGYGWRIIAPDLGASNVPLIIQKRLDTAIWSDFALLNQNGSMTLLGLPSLSFASDAAAAAAGVAIGGIYHTGGVVKVRLT